MRVLFLHQNFPAQFVHIAGALKRAGHDVRAIKEGHDSRPEIVPTVRYTHSSPLALDQIPMLARSFAERVRRGETVAKTMLALRGGGFEPDLVVGHFGWGETLFVKDVWPGTKLIVYAEYFYSAEGSDVDFDPEFIDSTSIPEAFLRRAAVRTRNAAILLALQSADFAVTSTDWQRSRFPIELQGRISVLHEGIDTKRVAPDPEASLRLSSHGRQVIFRPGDEVITFVNRNLEPYRGYHVFMRALPSILAERQIGRAHV